MLLGRPAPIRRYRSRMCRVWALRRVWGTLARKQAQVWVWVWTFPQMLAWAFECVAAAVFGWALLMVVAAWLCRSVYRWVELACWRGVLEPASLWVLACASAEAACRLAVQMLGEQM